MKPKILLSQPLNGQNYIEAICACGADAYLEAYPTEEEGYDALVLCGGGDINPIRFGEENNGSYGIDYRRDECELLVLDKFVKAQKPVLAICRGCQVVNVYFGGTLVQDIGNGAPHKEEGDAIHSVIAEGDSAVRRLYGERFTVNSMHHQAINRVGKDLFVTHRATVDGVIEGLEHKFLDIVCVQWHPERLCLSRKREGAVDGLKLFEYFVELVKSRK